MRPPRYLTAFARIVIPRRNREFILGDLDELYAATAAARGPLTAGLHYMRGALGSALAQRLAHRRSTTGIGASGGRGLGRLLGDSATDARQAFRSLRRGPGFTLMVAATLALGIGSTAAVFTMVNQLILRPLPGAANSRTAAYLRFGRPGTYVGLNLSDFEALRERATLLDGIASYGSATPNVSLGDRRPIQAVLNTVYGDFFEMLGVQPAGGRLLTGSDTDLDANPLIVVISERLRSRLFTPNEEAVGQTLRVNGQPVSIVGIAGGGFQGPERGREVDAWMPHGALVPLVGFTRERLTSPESTMHSQVLALPRPGVTLEAAEAQVAEILARLAEANPDRADHLSELRPTFFAGLETPPLVRDLTKRTLRMMTWAVALILAIACANVANLLLFRSLTRRGALATLRAFGASRSRLARQHMAESLLLAFLGGVAGLGVAWLIMIPFRGEQLVRMPAFEGFIIGPDVLTFVGVASLVAAALFGIVPAWLAGRFDLGAALGTTQARETGRLGSLRLVLSAGQIAMTLALVVGGLLLVQTIGNLRNVETGVDVTDVVRVTVDSPEDSDPAELHALQRELLEQVVAVPGVEGAALDVYGPHSSRTLGRIGLPGAMEEDEPRESKPMIWQVTPGWFELFGVRLVHGRTFEDSDWQVPPADPIILTASLARRLFGRTDVVGRTVLAGIREPVERRIVGVVGDYRSLRSPAEPTDAYFVPYGDFPRAYVTLFAKTSPPDNQALMEIRAVVESLFPDVAVPDPVRLEETVADIHREERMLGRFLWILSGFGLLMSSVGLYAAIYFVVANRKREFGVRLALGADGARILRLVGRTAVTIVVGGAALGLPAAYALSRVLENRLFGVEAFDIASYGGAALLLSLVALSACAAPARSALAADPVATLREE